MAEVKLREPQAPPPPIDLDEDDIVEQNLLGDDLPSPNDRKEKKRVQNRVAQRSYRQRMKTRVEELQARIKTLESENVGSTQPSDPNALSGISRSYSDLALLQQQHHHRTNSLESTYQIATSLADVDNITQSALYGLTPPGVTGTNTPVLQDHHHLRLSNLPHKHMASSTPTLPVSISDSSPLNHFAAAAGIPFDNRQALTSPQQELDFSLWMGSVSDAQSSDTSVPTMSSLGSHQPTFGASNLPVGFDVPGMARPNLHSTQSSDPTGSISGHPYLHTQQSMTTRTSEMSLSLPSTTSSDGQRPNISTLDPTDIASITERLRYVAEHSRIAGFESLDDMISTYYRSLSQDQGGPLGEIAGAPSRRLPRMIATLRHAVSEWRDWERRGFPLD